MADTMLQSLPRCCPSFRPAPNRPLRDARPRRCPSCLRASSARTSATRRFRARSSVRASVPAPLCRDGYRPVAGRASANVARLLRALRPIHPLWARAESTIQPRRANAQNPRSSTRARVLPTAQRLFLSRRATIDANRKNHHQKAAREKAANRRLRARSMSKSRSLNSPATAARFAVQRANAAACDATKPRSMTRFAKRPAATRARGSSPARKSRRGYRLEAACAKHWRRRDAPIRQRARRCPGCNDPRKRRRVFQPPSRRFARASAPAKRARIRSCRRAASAHRATTRWRFARLWARLRRF